MAKSRGVAWGAFLCLLLAPAPLYAAKLTVKSDRRNLATGYFLVPRGEHNNLPRDERQRFTKISNNQYWAHALTDTPNLVAGTYYLYPECTNRLQLRWRRITENDREVTLECR